MSAVLTQAADCSCECPTSSSSSVPGPQGEPGADGTNGTDGVDAFTTTTSNFTQPASAADTASIPVVDSTWMVVGQAVFVLGGGYYTVISKADATHVVLNNLGYAGNAAPAAVITSGAQISPAGIRGATGASGATSTLNDLSPTTTKGDILIDNGTNNPLANLVRFPVGTNGMRLKADSTQATGHIYEKVALNDTAQVTGATAIANGGTGQITNTLGFNALAPASAALGDIITNNGTNWIRLARGTKTQVLTVGNANALVWTDRGRTIQEVIAQTVAATVTHTAIPYDDSIPQSTLEGEELFSQSFTPKDTDGNSYAIVECLLNVTADLVDNIVIALFKDSGANAIAANSVYQGTANKTVQIGLVHKLALTGVALTLKLRIGTGGGNYLIVNGIDDGSHNAARRLGGVQVSWMKITEMSVPGF